MASRLANEEEIQNWCRTISDKELGNNVRMFVHQFVPVPPEVYDHNAFVEERLVFANVIVKIWQKFLRNFIDNLVIPEDSEIFAEVACLLQLHDSPIADMDTPEDIAIDTGHDSTKPQLEKVQRITQNNRVNQIPLASETSVGTRHFCS